MTFAVAIGSVGSSGGATILYGNTTGTRYSPLTQLTLNPTLSPETARRTLHIVSAKKFSSRSGRNRPGTTTTTDQEPQRTVEIEDSVDDAVDDGFVMPKLPGDEPDFWEGPQWDWLGFVVEYLWAFGLVFAAIACLIAATTYNEGATDFKDTPAYKESVQTREFLEEPEASDSDVFESNPTEVAPSLE